MLDRPIKCGTAASLFLLLLTFQSNAQINVPAVEIATNRPAIELRERLRAECLAGRRRICGKILELLPTGLVVESGYTNLLRDPLTRNWLVPGTATASLAGNLVESADAGAVCVGRVFLSNLPKGRGAKPKRYDYVIMEGFPCGQTTYVSSSGISHSVRWFSANLNKAVEINLAQTLKRADAAPAEK